MHTSRATNNWKPSSLSQCASMGSQTISILTEGVWASLTGGWYYDKKQSHFANLFHLYIWLFFLCLPLVNYLFFNTLSAWIVYCLLIGLIFAIIKGVNAYFHRVFDTGKCIKEDDENVEKVDDDENRAGRENDFEMTILSNSRDNSEFVARTDCNASNVYESIRDDEESAATKINLQADVHCSNDSDQSSVINLAALFANVDHNNESASREDKEVIVSQSNNDDVPQAKWMSNKSLADASTIAEPFSVVISKGVSNSSNNSIGLLDTYDYSSTSNINNNNNQFLTSFRRARSELEAIKSCDKSTKATAEVPPSHPVSMETITNNLIANNEQETIHPLGTSRFNKESTSLNKIGVVSSPKECQHYGRMSLKQPTDLMIKSMLLNIPVTHTPESSISVGNLEKIEESQEKPVDAKQSQRLARPSTPYAKDDSSEDGDESDVSLFNEVSSTSLFSSTTTRPSKPSSRKSLKQPMRSKTKSPATRRKRKSRLDDRVTTTYEMGETKKQKLRTKSKVMASQCSSDDSSDEAYSLFRYNAEANKEKRRTVKPSPSSSSSSSSSSSFSLDPSSSKSSLETQRSHLLKLLSGTLPSTSTGRRSKVSTINELRAIRQRRSTPNAKHRRTARTMAAASSHRAAIRPRSSAISLAASKVEDDSLNANLLADLISAPGKHLATGHEDTSAGSVHLFQDERGNWLSYTFDDNSTGVAKNLPVRNPVLLMDALAPSRINKPTYQAELAQLDANESAMLQHAMDVDSHIFPENVFNSPSSDSLDWLNRPITNRVYLRNHDLASELIQVMSGTSYYDPHRRAYSHHFSPQSFSHHFSPQSYSHSSPNVVNRQSQYYEVNLCNVRKVKVRFDRLSLLAFLDRNLSTFELILSILLAIMVSAFSSVLLSQQFFSELSLGIFCLVVASSQYTLLKSVQPDAASPTHGFNRITIYGRPVYFCLMSCLLLVSHYYYSHYDGWHLQFEVYGVDLFSRQVAHSVFSLSRMLLLLFPVLFTIGFMPQINTFVIYVCEQMDIHLFGGTASTIGMVSAIYSLVRSILLIALLYLVALILNISDNSYVSNPKASFSVFCGIMMALSYHVSRLPSDPSLVWNAIGRLFRAIGRFFGQILSSMRGFGDKERKNSQSTANDLAEEQKLAKEESKTDNKNTCGLIDPLPEKLRSITLTRIESDFLIGIFIAIMAFAVHVSSIFKIQPFMEIATLILASYWGLSLHYFIFQLSKQHPWLCFANPVCRTMEYKSFEVKAPAEIMSFEIIQAWLWLLEKNVVFPLVFLNYITSDLTWFVEAYGEKLGILLLVVCSVKCFRSTFNDPSHNYIILVFTYLFFNFDCKHLIGLKSNIFLLNYFFGSIVYHKVIDFLLKFRFVITYVAPWQITWGSAFHAFAQPFSVPHSAMLLVQLCISSMLSSPLQPIFGSAIFFTSYVRPIKFWERDYNTKRVDHSNTRLASQIDRAQIGSDDNNLNSIFYEHLTRSLQHSLYGDIVLGRWGVVNQGDCFVLASDNLNCLVHIIELGNGLVTFQVRGLEFRGTYCQQREVEAISESISDDEGCCCCEPGHVRGMLSLNAAFNQRWLSWQIAQTNYVLEGYSISENSATAILTPYDLRKALITYYVKSIIYYTITCNKLTDWLESRELQESLSYLNEKTFIDLDPTFNFNIDEDYDVMASGITRASFKTIYADWIAYCVERFKTDAARYSRVKENEDSLLSLCLGLSLVARRALSNGSHNSSSTLGVEFFLHGFHSLFKGDVRIHCQRDEWVFQDMDFLNKVKASVRMALKLHQEQFATCDEYENHYCLFQAITTFDKSIIISHEADPVWRNAILSNVTSLLSLRHVFEEGNDQYKVIMLNKKFLNFRVIKINRECVRGLWAGQQQELIFLRNRNQERGSIQNAKQVLRNIINSSCDQPIGYPIYVSPLTTSFAESNSQLSQVIGPPISFSMFKRAICGFFLKISTRCSEVCSGGSGGVANHELGYAGNRTSNLSNAKSESSDRDDSFRGPMMSTHQQMTNYSLYLKKRAKQDKPTSAADEEQAVPLVNLQNTRANVRANSMSVSEGSATGVLAHKPTNEATFANLDPSQVLLANPKGADVV